MECKKRISEYDSRVSYLQAELLQRDQANKVLAQQLQDAVKRHQDEAEVSKQFMSETLKRAHDLFLKKEALLLDKHQEALKELSELRVFDEAKGSLMQQLHDTQTLLRETEKKHKAQLEQLEARFIAAREHMRSEAQELLAQSRREYKREAVQELDHEGKLIRAQNLRLFKQLKVKDDQCSGATKRAEELGKELHELKLEHEMLQERFDSVCQRKVVAQQQCDTYKGRVGEANRLVATASAVAERERRAHQDSAGRETSRLNKELAELKALVVRKDREVRQLRKHARVLLTSRKDVETFFADALEEVKAEIRVKQEAAYRGQMKQHQQRLAALARGMPDTLAQQQTGFLPPLPPSKAIGLADLSAEDRFEVIRLIYARLRGIPTATRARFPPVHTVSGEAGDLGPEPELEPLEAMPGDEDEEQEAEEEAEAPLAVTHVPEPAKPASRAAEKRPPVEPSFFLTDALVADEPEEEDCEGPLVEEPMFQRL
jgi:hypothetical protein